MTDFRRVNTAHVTQQHAREESRWLDSVELIVLGGSTGALPADAHTRISSWVEEFDAQSEVGGAEQVAFSIEKTGLSVIFIEREFSNAGRKRKAPSYSGRRLKQPRLAIRVRRPNRSFQKPKAPWGTENTVVPTSPVPGRPSAICGNGK